MNNKREKKLTEIQLITGILFLVSFIVSLSLTYDSLKKYNNKNILSNKQRSRIYYINRIVVTILLLIYLYISYEQYKIGGKTKTERKILLDEVIAGVIAVIAGLIVLYDSYLSFKTNEINVENPEI